MARLLEKYRTEVHPKLKEELGVRNPLAVPRLEKIVISMGIGQAVQDKKYIEMHSKELAQIAGQRPLVCKARKSVSNFKLREGQAIGLKVTLRGHRMYEFLDRLANIAVPRVRDFRGLNPSGFDGRGNFSMGLSEQTVFPEVSPDAVERRQGMNITLVTSAHDDRMARQLLTLMGLPFATANKE
jgi:large subunit ribosomal protein L5